MSEQLSALARIITSLGRALKPLLEATDTTDGLVELLDEVGVNPAVDLPGPALDELRAALRNVLIPIASPTDIDDVITNWPDVMNAFASNLPEVLEGVGERLVGSLIASLLQREAPCAFALLVFIGVIGLEPLGPSSICGRPRSRWVVRWSLVLGILSNPSAMFSTTYGWGTPHFDPAALLRNLRNVLLLAGIPAGLKELESDGFRTDVSAACPELRVPVLVQENEATSVEVGFALRATSDSTNAFFDGVMIVPFGTAEVESGVDLGNGWTFGARVEVGSGSGSGIGLVLRSGGRLSVASANGGDQADATCDLSVDIARSSQTRRVVLFGATDTSRLEVSAIELLANAGVRSDTASEWHLELSIRDGCLVIDTKEADGFVSKMLTQGLESPFELTVGFSNRRGVYFGGSAGLEVAIPIHACLGPLELEQLSVGACLRSEPPVLELRMSVDVGLELGPLSAAISGVGSKLEVIVSGSPCCELSFLPPTGAGFALDAGPVVGGGFLDFDELNERYSGILALECMGIGVTAVGLITTKMPDGSKGFSMLVSIGITFNPPIQIYMGFTLSGVGGLIGVNRTMMTDVLREGIRGGTLNSILFPDPKWVIPNAEEVISNLGSVFPAAEGRFVIGPMARIGYGTPNFIIGEVGVFLEVPEPVKVVLLGRVRMSLPAPATEMVAVNIDIAGILDLEKKELSFQASLRASSLLVFELYGDCAFFLRWGSQPEMALAIGGFHPSFRPPAPPSVFAGLRRLGVNINYGPFIQLGCSGYLAVTPNSLQLGARVDISVGINALSLGIKGFLSFDSMITFSPFSFDVGMAGGLALKVGDFAFSEVRVDFSLAGPTPWNIRGKAKVGILFFEVEVAFDETWGRSDAARLDAEDPWPRLAEALARADSWGSRLPPGSSMVETLANLEEETKALRPMVGWQAAPPATVVVHPAGAFEIRQNVAPLEITLTKLGNAPMVGHDRFSILRVSAGSVSLAVEPIDEFFSRGQFQDLSNAQKLSVPSFEKLPGGVKTSSSEMFVVQGEARTATVDFKSILVESSPTAGDPQQRDRRVGRANWMPGKSLGGPVRKGTLRARGKARFAHTGEPLVSTFEERYVIVVAKTMQRRADIGGKSMTCSQAEEALALHLRVHLEDRRALIVVRESELNEEAA